MYEKHLIHLNIMKIKSIITIAMMAGCLVAVSCNKKPGAVMVQATVTAKTLSNDLFVLQVDDNTLAVPSNVLANPYKKEVRAITVYYDFGPAEGPDGSPYKWRDVQIAQMDSIRTKKPVAPESAIQNAGIELYRSWTNTIEDGYLTLNFEAMFGVSDKVHFINLETTETPYVFVLKHDNNGDADPVRYGGGLIAFDMHGLLPKAEGSEVVINYTGYGSKAKAIKFVVKDGSFDGPYSADYGTGFVSENPSRALFE